MDGEEKRYKVLCDLVNAVPASELFEIEGVYELVLESFKDELNEHANAEKENEGR